MAILTAVEIREYLSDKPELNHLLDGVEFPDAMISIAMDLAVNEFNLIPPLSAVDINTFPNRALLMSGTIYKMLTGQATLLARNTMAYNDGGVSIPIEERAQLYQSLAATFQSDFQTAARAYKIQANYKSGWGGISSDYGQFPLW